MQEADPARYWAWRENLIWIKGSGKNMDNDFIIDHLLLVVGWMLFGVFHSLLASVAVKKRMHRLLGSYFIYYRLFYSCFALLNVVLLLTWQFSINSIVLWHTPGYLQPGILILLLAGLTVMVITSVNYFVLLSGVQVFKKEKRRAVLLQRGLHRFVRHPLYAGTIVFAWSLLFFFPQLNHLLACCLLTLYTLVGIKWEERRLLEEYGTTYKQYQQKVPMLIPFTK